MSNSDINLVDFTKYRDMAPALVTDDKIIEVMRLSKGDSAAITRAIDNMWQDIPDSKAVNGVAEWDVTPTEKRKAAKKKGEVSTPASGKEVRADKSRGLKSVAPKPVTPLPPQSSTAVKTYSTTVPHVVPVQERVHVPIGSSTVSQWSSTHMTIAEKLKQAELLKNAPPVPEEPVAPVIEVGP